jgi:hypothetical protein
LRDLVIDCRYFGEAGTVLWEFPGILPGTRFAPFDRRRLR